LDGSSAEEAAKEDDEVVRSAGEAVDGNKDEGEQRRRRWCLSFAVVWMRESEEEKMEKEKGDGGQGL